MEEDSCQNTMYAVVGACIGAMIAVVAMIADRGYRNLQIHNRDKTEHDGLQKDKQSLQGRLDASQQPRIDPQQIIAVLKKNYLLSKQILAYIQKNCGETQANTTVSANSPRNFNFHDESKNCDSTENYPVYRNIENLGRGIHLHQGAQHVALNISHAQTLHNKPDQYERLLQPARDRSLTAPELPVYVYMGLNQQENLETDYVDMESQSKDVNIPSSRLDVTTTEKGVLPEHYAR